MKNFIEVNGSHNFNIIFNESIEDMKQMKLNNQKQSGIKSFIRTIYSYCMKKILHLNICCLFLPRKSEDLYSGHLVVANTFFRDRRCPE